MNYDTNNTIHKIFKNIALPVICIAYGIAYCTT